MSAEKLSPTIDGITIDIEKLDISIMEDDATAPSDLSIKQKRKWANFHGNSTQYTPDQTLDYTYEPIKYTSFKDLSDKQKKQWLDLYKSTPHYCMREYTDGEDTPSGVRMWGNSLN